MKRIVLLFSLCLALTGCSIKEADTPENTVIAYSEAVESLEIKESTENINKEVTEVEEVSNLDGFLGVTVNEEYIPLPVTLADFMGKTDLSSSILENMFIHPDRVGVVDLVDINGNNIAYVEFINRGDTEASTEYCQITCIEQELSKVNEVSDALLLEFPAGIKVGDTFCLENIVAELGEQDAISDIIDSTYYNWEWTNETQKFSLVVAVKYGSDVIDYISINHRYWQ